MLLACILADASIILEPVPLCRIGEEAVHTCSITRGTLLRWSYETTALVTIVPSEPFSNVLRSSNGVNFTVSLVSSSHDKIVSEIRFVVSKRVHGATLTCDGVDDKNPVRRMITLLVDSSDGKKIQSDSPLSLSFCLCKVPLMSGWALPYMA